MVSPLRIVSYSIIPVQLFEVSRSDPELQYNFFFWNPAPSSFFSCISPLYTLHTKQMWSNQLYFVKSPVKISNINSHRNIHNGKKADLAGLHESLWTLTNLVAPVWVVFPVPSRTRFRWVYKPECPTTHIFAFLKTGQNSALLGATPKIKPPQCEVKFCLLTQHRETDIKGKKNPHHNQTSHFIPHLKSFFSSPE